MIDVVLRRNDRSWWAEPTLPAAAGTIGLSPVTTPSTLRLWSCQSRRVGTPLRRLRRRSTPGFARRSGPSRRKPGRVAPNRCRRQRSGSTALCHTRGDAFFLTARLRRASRSPATDAEGDGAPGARKLRSWGVEGFRSWVSTTTPLLRNSQTPQLLNCLGPRPWSHRRRS